MVATTSTIQSNPCEAEAIKDIERGWELLPVWHIRPDSAGICACRDGVDCTHPAKHPRVTNWESGALRTAKKVRQTFRMMPLANIGILTGPASCLFVLDIDPRHGGTKSWERLRHTYGLPDALMVNTGGGGQQAYFAYPADVPGADRIVNEVGLPGYPGIDIRTRGGMVVAPSSLHRSGNRYTWANDLELATLPLAFVHSLIPPEKLATPSPAGDVRRPSSDLDASARYWLDRYAANAYEGRRNTNGFNLACQLRDEGLSEEDAEPYVMAYADQVSSQGNTPYNRSEALKSLRSAYKRPPRERARPEYNNNSHNGPYTSSTGAAVEGEAVNRQDGQDDGTGASTAGEGQPPLADELIAKLTATDDAAQVLDAAPLLAQLATTSIADYGKVKLALKSHFGKNLNLNDLEKAVHQAKRVQARATIDEDSGGLPQIVASGRPLRDMTRDAMACLHAANEPPVLFSRSGSLVRIRDDEKGRPIIDPVNNPILRWRLARVANFVHETEEGPKHIPPPHDVVTDVLALPGWEFPGLVGITEVPVLRPDGSLVTEPGYDAAMGLIYKPARELVIPCVPMTPADADVDRALALIWETNGEFPYIDGASKANALALLLTPVLRPAIDGQVPLALIDAPKAGTGKGLLADVISYVATGRATAVMTAPRDEEEWRKRLTSTLEEGATVISIDNVVDRLASPSLAAVLTAQVWRDRRLGHSENITLPQRATWVATGNNIRLGGDIPRRCYWIRLDAKMAKPWQRSAFTHPELLDWVRQQRGKLLAALLTVARSWFVAGRPAAATTPALGSFQTWASLLSGVLAHVGVDGFLGNMEALYEAADEETPQWFHFFAAWHQKYKDTPKTTKEVVNDLTDNDGHTTELGEALPDTLATALADKAKTFTVKLGKALGQQVEVRHGEHNLRLVKEDVDPKAHKGVSRWQVKVDPISPPSEVGGRLGDVGDVGDDSAYARCDTPTLVDAVAGEGVGDAESDHVRGNSHLNGHLLGQQGVGDTAAQWGESSPTSPNPPTGLNGHKLVAVAHRARVVSEEEDAEWTL